MELIYQVNKETKPNILEKLLCIHKSEYISETVSLFLTDTSSRKLVPGKLAAQIFGKFIHRLAKEFPIRFLFPYEVGEVMKRLSNYDITATEERRWLWLETNCLELLEVIQILETASFTTFYADVNGSDVIPQKPADLLDDIKHKDFLIVFSLYDDSIEILSTKIHLSEIVDLVQQVGIEEGLKVTQGS